MFFYIIVCVSWNEICRDTYNNIKEQTNKIKNNEKCDYAIDEFNTLKFLRYGPVVEHKNDINGEIEFLPIKQNIVLDIEKLKRGEYSTVELVEYKNSFIGIYEGEPLYIKIGKFGLYVEHNSKNYKVSNSVADITMDKAIEIMNSDEKMKNVSTTILRFVNNDISVRNGKNGKPYIFYKTKSMKKPIFISVNKSDILTCPTKDIIDIVDIRNK